MQGFGPMVRLFSALALCSVVTGCGAAANKNTDTLKLGAYSVVREVFHDGLTPAFTARWKSKTGRDVQFEESYNGSGAQARSIASGFDADLAILSHRGRHADSGKGREGQVRLEHRAGGPRHRYQEPGRDWPSR